MTYIQIIEPNSEIISVLKNITAAEGVENIFINKKDSDEMTELLCAAHLDREINLENYSNLKIIIAGVKDFANIKNIPPEKQSRIQIITCGWEEKDTFTYSSVNEDEMILNLQRKIIALNGETISPCEIKAARGKYNLTNQDDESVLFAFCIYQCTGNNFH